MSLSIIYRATLLTHSSSKQTNVLDMSLEIQPWESRLSAWAMAQKELEMI